MKFEVIIVGAGPAGAYTAYQLAKENINILLLEQEQLPRYKSCGGAVSLKSREILTDFNLNSIIEEKINSITFSYDSASPLTIKLEKPFVQLVMRDKFDHFLTKQAQKQGAQIIDNTEVTNLVVKENEIKVSTRENKFTGQVIVGADGVNSLISNQLGIKPVTNTAVGFEKEIQVPSTRLQNQKHQISLDYGIVPRGYGWVFPKQDHLSVGVATYQQGINLRQKLATYLQQENLTNCTELTAQGHLLPMWKQAAKLNTERGLVVGDAAGLVDPFSGEGIYYALKSGQLASQAIIKHLHSQQSLTTYTKQINTTIVPGFKTAKLLIKPFFYFPKKIHQLINSKPAIFKELLQVIYGAKTYNNLYKVFLDEIPLFQQLVNK